MAAGGRPPGPRDGEARNLTKFRGVLFLSARTPSKISILKLKLKLFYRLDLSAIVPIELIHS